MAGRGDDREVGLFAYLFNELGRAFTDIRQRVVEEGWFGRVTTPPTRRDFDPLHRTHNDNEVADRSARFDAQWSPDEHAGQRQQMPERSHEFDR